jgi:CRP-like cAMP-binding protein
MPITLHDMNDDEVEEFGPGEIIFTQGESAEHMYLVLEGEVEFRTGGNLLATVGEGAVMGEMAILEAQPRSAMAVASGDVRLLPVDRERFEQLVRKNPEFALTVLRTMARRLRQMNIAAGGTGGEGGGAPKEGSERLIAAVKGHAARPAGSTIFEEGEPGNTMYLVQFGIVELRVAGHPVGKVETGGFFGEMALLENAPRSASAHARTDCGLMSLDRKKFDFLIQRTPDFVVEMMRVMAKRIRHMNEETREE